MHRILCGGVLLWDRVSCADTPYTRFKGLMGKRTLEEGEALLIRPCNQVHMFHMRFALDVIYLDRKMQVVRIDTLQPNRIGAWIRHAAYVLETTAGDAARYGIHTGDTLSLE